MRYIDHNDTTTYGNDTQSYMGRQNTNNSVRAMNISALLAEPAAPAPHQLLSGSKPLSPYHAGINPTTRPLIESPPPPTPKIKLHDLPTEMLQSIALYLSERDIASLQFCNHQLHIILEPYLYWLAVRRGRQTSLLQRAAMLGNVHATRMLHDAGADIDSRIGCILSPAYDSWFRVAERLRGFTPLYVACMYGQVEVVRLLLDYGAKIDAGRLDVHIEPLAREMSVPFMETTEQGLLHVMVMNPLGPLGGTFGPGHAAVLSLLLERGLDINARGIGGNTALHYAAIFRDYNLTKILLERGADSSISCGKGLKPLHRAVMMPKRDPVLEFLNVVTPERWTTEAIGILPQFRQFKTWHLEPTQFDPIFTVKALVEHGADVNAQGLGSTSTFTALHAACRSASEDVVRFLLENGAETEDEFIAQTTPSFIVGYRSGLPLHLAIRSGRIDNVLALLDHGANIDAIGSSGHTALMCAVSRPRKMVELLLDRGAGINVIAGNNRTVLDHTVIEAKRRPTVDSYQYKAMAKFLKDRGATRARPTRFPRPRDNDVDWWNPPGYWDNDGYWVPYTRGVGMDSDGPWRLRGCANRWRSE